MTKSGNIYSCDCNNHGQLGIRSDIESQYFNENNIMTSSIPIVRTLRKVNLPPIDKIACGDNHSVIVTIDGDIYPLNTNDNLGLSDKLNRPYPVKLIL